LTKAGKGTLGKTARTGLKDTGSAAQWGKGTDGCDYGFSQLVLEKPEEMDKQGEKVTRCDCAFPEQGGLIDTSVGRSECMEINGFSTSYHTGNMYI
jgi:hypothetical protein